MKQKRYCLLAALLVCLLLAGCAGKELPKMETVQEEQTPASTALPEKVQVPEAASQVFYSRTDYLYRVLSDEELTALLEADAETLRESISTIGDAVAYLDRFSPRVFDGFGGEIRLDLDFLLDLHRKPEATTPQTYTAFAAWCLADDFEGISYVIGLADVDGMVKVLPALALPVQEGYLVFPPHRLSAIKNEVQLLREQKVSDLSRLKGALSSEFELLEIYTADANQRTLTMVLDEVEGLASPDQGEVCLQYPKTQAERQEIQKKKLETRIAFAYSHLLENYASYGMPETMAPTMNETQIRVLVGQDLKAVAESCQTLGDCLYYYALSGFQGSDGDVRVQDPNFGEGYFEWHFNYGPEQVFLKNRGNCGASSGLTARLLQGDYPTVGILGMTFTKDEGGHFINYIFDGSRYHVFDVVNLLAIFDQSGFCFSSGDTLLEAARLWTEHSGFPVKCIWAFERFEGDLPVGWDESNTSYLPRAYKDQGTILLETPEEGYVYEWVEISDAIWNRIQGMQNPAVAAGDGAAE